MRTMVWVLLLLNGVVAAVWLSGVTVPAAAPQTLSLSGSESAPLRLLSELPQPPRLLDIAEPGDGVIADSDPVEQGQGLVAEVHASPVAAAAVPTVASAAAEAPEPTSATAQGSAEQPDATEPVDETPAAASSHVDPDQESGAAVTGPVCYRTAALSGDVYQAAGASLRAAGFDTLDVQPLNGARPRYWVYWSGDVAQVGAVEARLRSAAVRDWYRMRMPGREARLALGVYGQMSGARSRQRALAGKGVQAQVDERYAPQASLRWVVHAAPAQVESVEAGLIADGVRLERCP